MFDANCLRWRLQLDAVEVEMKGAHLFQTGLRLHVDAVAVQLHMTRDLEVVLLLTHEGIVRVGEVETLVSVNSEVRDRSEKGCDLRFLGRYENVGNYSQFLMIVVQQRVPLVLLEETKSDALNLRPVRAAVIALRQCTFNVTVTAFVLDVVEERARRLAFLG